MHGTLIEKDHFIVSNVKCTVKKKFYRKTYHIIYSSIDINIYLVYDNPKGTFLNFFWEKIHNSLSKYCKKCNKKGLNFYGKYNSININKDDDIAMWTELFKKKRVSPIMYNKEIGLVLK